MESIQVKCFPSVAAIDLVHNQSVISQTETSYLMMSGDPVDTGAYFGHLVRFTVISLALLYLNRAFSQPTVCSDNLFLFTFLISITLPSGFER